MKIIVTQKQAKILNWIFTIIYLILAFWCDWRIGLAFVVFDISRAFEERDLL
jgi:hypothetical protein